MNHRYEFKQYAKQKEYTFRDRASGCVCPIIVTVVFWVGVIAVIGSLYGIGK